MRFENEKNRKADKEFIYELVKGRHHGTHSKVAMHIDNDTIVYETFCLFQFLMVWRLKKS